MSKTEEWRKLADEADVSTVCKCTELTVALHAACDEIEAAQYVSGMYKAERDALRAELHKYKRWSCESCGCSFCAGGPDAIYDGVKRCTTCVELEVTRAEVERLHKEAEHCHAGKDEEYSELLRRGEEIKALRQQNAQMRQLIEAIAWRQAQLFNYAIHNQLPGIEEENAWLRAALETWREP